MRDAELYIGRLYRSGTDDTVRIDVRDGQVTLARVDVSIEDFARALFGQSAVPCTLSKLESKT